MPATICKAGLTQPKSISDFKALTLKTEAWPRTTGPAVPEFMSCHPATNSTVPFNVNCRFFRRSQTLQCAYFDTLIQFVFHHNSTMQDFISIVESLLKPFLENYDQSLTRSYVHNVGPQVGITYYIYQQYLQSDTLKHNMVTAVKKVPKFLQAVFFWLFNFCKKCTNLNCKHIKTQRILT